MNAYLRGWDWGRESPHKWSTKQVMNTPISNSLRLSICIWANRIYSKCMCVCTPTHTHNKMSLIMVFFNFWLWHLKIFGNARPVCPRVAHRTAKLATVLFAILIANLIAGDKIRFGFTFFKGKENRLVLVHPGKEFSSAIHCWWFSELH